MVQNSLSPSVVVPVSHATNPCTENQNLSVVAVKKAKRNGAGLRAYEEQSKSLSRALQATEEKRLEESWGMAWIVSCLRDSADIFGMEELSYFCHRRSPASGRGQTLRTYQVQLPIVSLDLGTRCGTLFFAHLSLCMLLT